MSWRALGALVACAIAWIPAAAWADTVIPAGPLRGLVTLTARDSPYVIDGPVVVPASGTVLINPGVVVRFTATGSLTIDGEVHGAGAPGEELLFTGADAAAPTGAVIVSSGGRMNIGSDSRFDRLATVESSGSLRLTGATVSTLLVVTGGATELGTATVVSAAEIRAGTLTLSPGATLTTVSVAPLGDLRADSATIDGVLTNASVRTRLDATTVASLVTTAAMELVDSDVRGTATSTGDGTIVASGTIFRGVVTDHGRPSVLDHVSLLGGYDGTAASTVTSSFARATGPGVICAVCTFDHSLIHEFAPGSRVEVGVETASLGREDPLLGAEDRPTAFSPLRFRGVGGTDAGARAFTGEPTGRWTGWLWGITNMRRENQGALEGRVVIPAGSTLVVDLAAVLDFAPRAGQPGSLQLEGTLVLGDRSREELDTGYWFATARTVVLGSTDGSAVTIEGPGSLIAHSTRFDPQVSLRVDRISVEQVSISGLVEARDLRAMQARFFGEVRAERAVLYMSELSDSAFIGAEGLDAENVTFLAPLSLASGRAVEITCSVLVSDTTGVSLGDDVTPIFADVVLQARTPFVGFAPPAGLVVVDDAGLDERHIPLPSSPCRSACTVHPSLGRYDIDGVALSWDWTTGEPLPPEIGAYEAIEPDRCPDPYGPGPTVGSTCSPPRGVYGPRACPADCRGLPPVCGDGVVNAPWETCDSTHGCLACGASCGDGRATGPEECDDGNTNDDDGCTASCFCTSRSPCLPPDDVVPFDGGVELSDASGEADVGVDAGLRAGDAATAPLDSAADAAAHPPDGPSSGCGCRTQPRAPLSHGGWAWMPLVLGLANRWRRRDGSRSRRASR